MEAMVHSPDGPRLISHCNWSLGMKYISTIYVYNLLRLHTMNVNRSKKEKKIVSHLKS